MHGSIMRYRILGTVDVLADDGRWQPPAGRKQRLLLAALLRHSRRVATVDRLIEYLWEERLPQDPAAALQTQVSRLRTFLRDAGAGDPITSEPYGYRLSVERDSIDAHRFEALVAQARHTAVDDTPGNLRLRGVSPPLTAEDALDRIEAALALWRGAPFEEFDRMPVFLAEATRLRELRASALQARAELLLALGRTTDAIAACNSLAVEDPLQERPIALLMEALYRGGRQGEALDVFRKFRHRLSEELGLGPSPSLRQLELEILRHERAVASHERQPSRTGTVVTGAIGSAPAMGEAEGGSASAAPVLRIAHVELPGGGTLARAEAGTAADPVLAMLPAWVSSLSAIGAGTDPRSAFLAKLAERARLILYDRYGMGLSAAPVDEITIDHDISELLAVLDAARIRRAVLLALSQAGPPALTFAARHPDRVAGIVLFGTYASGPLTFPRQDLRDSMVGLVRAHWGIGSKALSDLIVPDATAEEAAGFARVQREAATPALAAMALESFFSADVTHLLPAIRCPALVLHYTSDRAIPFRGGQELAAQLPDARLVALDGLAHLPRTSDLNRITDLIVDFATRVSRPADR